MPNLLAPVFYKVCHVVTNRLFKGLLAVFPMMNLSNGWNSVWWIESGLRLWVGQDYGKKMCGEIVQQS